MDNKRGQFYIVAAIIIVLIAVGFLAVSNYTTTEEDIRIYDLRDKLDIESAKVLDHGTYQELNDTELKQLLINFTRQYNDTEENLLFIFGDENNVTIIEYSELEPSNITFVEEGEEEETDITLEENGDGESRQGEFSSGTGIVRVIVTFGEEDYTFEIKEGENFYFIIQIEFKGGEYVVTS